MVGHWLFVRFVIGHWFLVGGMPLNATAQRAGADDGKRWDTLVSAQTVVFVAVRLFILINKGYPF